MKSSPSVVELAHRALQYLARGEGAGLAVGHVGVAQHPAGARRPRQHLEGGGVGNDGEVGAALQALDGEAAVGAEHREHGLVRGVLGQQGGGEVHALPQGRAGLGGHQRLAAQDAVLVGPGEAHEVDFAAVDAAHEFARLRVLVVGPETEAVDEGVAFAAHGAGSEGGLRPQAVKAAQAVQAVQRPSRTSRGARGRRPASRPRWTPRRSRHARCRRWRAARSSRWPAPRR
jgi:hypothetical protein